MGQYVKVSDVNIIDLAAWQNLINVVNQHSDSIAKLVSTSGYAWNPVYQSDGSWSTTYDVGNQMILYGRQRMSSSGAGTTEVVFDTTKYVYEEVVNFASLGLLNFTSPPNVIGTMSRVNSTTAGITDYNLSISDITSISFKIRVTNGDRTEISDDVKWYVNWIAIGPK